METCFGSEISAFEFGAVADGVTDDSLAMNVAAAHCQKMGKPYRFVVSFISFNSYLRHCKVDATLRNYRSHNGIGVILGGAGNNANNPIQQ
ncbi:hypothetical protein [Pasteurella multocida]|uniref:hypothetical protein n=1 Tax=Pasteurella multocida TaxID=747 RepID=UPI001D10C52E|nr:hypothetical protein [Pasteurella multocida]